MKFETRVKTVVVCQDCLKLERRSKQLLVVSWGWSWSTSFW